MTNRKFCEKFSLWESRLLTPLQPHANDFMKEMIMFAFIIPFYVFGAKERLKETVPSAHPETFSFYVAFQSIICTSLFKFFVCIATLEKLLSASAV